ncbi:MAG: hypothetical protein H0W61_14275 [Bacteroidetes bacterium]|nr:hypothetical protein [Bacteroidota bacterium]
MKINTYSDPDPKKGINDKPAEEQQLEEDQKPVKQPGVESDESDDENALDEGLDDAEFDEFDENGGDEDFRDQLKTSEKNERGESKTVDEEMKERVESLDGIEGATFNITNLNGEIVNKNGQ